MDLDRFLATHSPSWDRLAQLTRRAGGGGRGLSAAELDELVHLYQRAATHLSTARTRYRDPGLVSRLTTLVAGAHAVVYGTRSRSLRAAGRFFTTTYPAAVWRLRPFLLASALLTFVPAVAMGAWIGTTTAAEQAIGDPALRAAYVQEQFADYYTSKAAAQFATEVTVNNIQVGLMAFALGIALVPAAAVLVFNGLNIGVAGGLFLAVGELPRFFGLILPHGLLELTAIVIAGGTGLRLGWTLVDPGDRQRSVALTDEGRRTVAVVIGTAGVFVVAGIIEGFITGAPLPTWVRVGTGAVVEAAFVAWIVVQGRAAARLGLTGAPGEIDPRDSMAQGRRRLAATAAPQP